MQPTMHLCSSFTSSCHMLSFYLMICSRNLYRRLHNSCEHGRAMLVMAKADRPVNVALIQARVALVLHWTK